MSAELLAQLEAYGDVFTAAVDTRALEETMRTDETIIPLDPTIETSTSRTAPWQPVAAALGVAAIVVAVIIGVAALRDGDTVASPPFTNPGAAVETLTFAENTGDWELYRSSLDDEATVDGGVLIDLPEGERRIEAGFFFSYGIGTRTEVQSCETTLATGGIGCVVTYTDGVGEALGLEAVDVPRTFRLLDGLFVYVGQWELPEEAPQVLFDFGDHLAQVGLQDELDMYFDDPTQWSQESAYELGQRLVAEAEAFMAAR